MRSSNLRLILKVIVFQIFFLILHYSYEWFPNDVTRIFSATDESVYQHMKVAFFSYILLAAGEYRLRRKSIVSRVNFIYSRLFSMIILPLIMIIYFMTSPAFFMKIENIPLEILFANIALLTTSFSTFLLEDHFEQTEPSRGLRIILILLVVFAFLEFLIFTYRLPWFDIFAIPPGWE
jgi:hypothetical protein